MRLMTTAIVLASLSWPAMAAPSWQNIFAESGRRIELDRSTMKREGNVVEAQSRVTLERALIDSRSGTPYRIIEAVTRYDCSTRSARTIKRTYKANEKDTLREEEVSGAELPVRSGTLDDRVLREVCRPPKETPVELAEKANEAATQLQKANEGMLKQELAKAQKPAPLKAVEVPPAADSSSNAAIPSIRPNLKAAAENPPAKPVPPVAEKPPAPIPAPSKALPAIRVNNGSTLAVRNNAPTPRQPTKPKPKPAADSRESYMLELAEREKSKLLNTHWSYEGAGGPENWAKLDPRNTLCASGQRQSPIDIREGIKVDLESIRFDYRPSTFRIVDNGHTVSVAVGDSSFSLTGKTYELEEVHFHRPAEMRINGQRYDMSVHLVHRSLDGGLAVVALLLERGTEHPEIQTLWNHIPLEKNAPVQPPNSIVDPARLLPESRQYYTFMGSLTTPPCTEGVLWLVMKQPVQVSDEQIRIFTRLYRNNARPAQAVGDRLIKESR